MATSDAASGASQTDAAHVALHLVPDHSGVYQGPPTLTLGRCIVGRTVSGHVSLVGAPARALVKLSARDAGVSVFPQSFLSRGEASHTVKVTFTALRVGAFRSAVAVAVSGASRAAASRQAFFVAARVVPSLQKRQREEISPVRKASRESIESFERIDRLESKATRKRRETLSPLPEARENDASSSNLSSETQKRLRAPVLRRQDVLRQQRAALRRLSDAKLRVSSAKQERRKRRRVQLTAESAQETSLCLWLNSLLVEPKQQHLLQRVSDDVRRMRNAAQTLQPLFAEINRLCSNAASNTRSRMRLRTDVHIGGSNGVLHGLVDMLAEFDSRYLSSAGRVVLQRERTRYSAKQLGSTDSRSVAEALVVPPARTLFEVARACSTGTDEAGVGVIMSRVARALCIVILCDYAKQHHTLRNDPPLLRNDPLRVNNVSSSNNNTSSSSNNGGTVEHDASDSSGIFPHISKKEKPPVPKKTVDSVAAVFDRFFSVASREQLRFLRNLARRCVPTLKADVLSHVSSVFDGADFTVTSLANDLRNGVRLCRLAEVLNPDKNKGTLQQLHQQRLQGTEAVEFALRHLGWTNSGHTMLDARAVASGHREGTLRVLWRCFLQCSTQQHSHEHLHEVRTETAWLERACHVLRRCGPNSDNSDRADQTDSQRPTAWMRCFGLGDELRETLKRWLSAAAKLAFLHYEGTVRVPDGNKSDTSRQVRNLGADLADGMFLLLLLRAYFPRLVPFSQIGETNRDRAVQALEFDASISEKGSVMSKQLPETLVVDVNWSSVVTREELQTRAIRRNHALLDAVSQRFDWPRFRHFRDMADLQACENEQANLALLEFLSLQLSGLARQRFAALVVERHIKPTPAPLSPLALPPAVPETTESNDTVSEKHGDEGIPEATTQLDDEHTSLPLLEDETQPSFEFSDAQLSLPGAKFTLQLGEVNFGNAFTPELADKLSAKQRQQRKESEAREGHAKQVQIELEMRKKEEKERELRERERKEHEQREQERRERELLEQERRERELREKEEKERELREKEQKENEQRERERKENERRERERKENERRENERKEREIAEAAAKATAEAAAEAERKRAQAEAKAAAEKSKLREQQAAEAAVHAVQCLLVARKSRKRLVRRHAAVSAAVRSVSALLRARRPLYERATNATRIVQRMLRTKLSNALFADTLQTRDRAVACVSSFLSMQQAQRQHQTFRAAVGIMQSCLVTRDCRRQWQRQRQEVRSAALLCGINLEARLHRLRFLSRLISAKKRAEETQQKQRQQQLLQERNDAAASLVPLLRARRANSAYREQQRGVLLCAKLLDARVMHSYARLLHRERAEKAAQNLQKFVVTLAQRRVFLQHCEGKQAATQAAQSLLRARRGREHHAAAAEGTASVREFVRSRALALRYKAALEKERERVRAEEKEREWIRYLEQQREELTQQRELLTRVHKEVHKMRDSQKRVHREVRHVRSQVHDVRHRVPHFRLQRSKQQPPEQQQQTTPEQQKSPDTQQPKKRQQLEKQQPKKQQPQKQQPKKQQPQKQHERQKSPEQSKPDESAVSAHSPIEQFSHPEQQPPKHQQQPQKQQHRRRSLHSSEVRVRVPVSRNEPAVSRRVRVAIDAFLHGSTLSQLTRAVLTLVDLTKATKTTAWTRRRLAERGVLRALVALAQSCDVQQQEVLEASLCVLGQVAQHSDDLDQQQQSSSPSLPLVSLIDQSSVSVRRCLFLRHGARVIAMCADVLQWHSRQRRVVQLACHLLRLGLRGACGVRGQTTRVSSTMSHFRRLFDRDADAVSRICETARVLKRRYRVHKKEEDERSLRAVQALLHDIRATGSGGVDISGVIDPGAIDTGAIDTDASGTGASGTSGATDPTDGDTDGRSQRRRFRFDGNETLGDFSVRVDDTRDEHFAYVEHESDEAVKMPPVTPILRRRRRALRDLDNAPVTPDKAARTRTGTDAGTVSGSTSVYYDDGFDDEDVIDTPRILRRRRVRFR
ncbi:MAG: hypothetical protein MHM6MM_004851 [Cercozoa sp. M6MM]